MTLRSVLECFNYRVGIQRVGSRPQFVEILRGSIPTFRDVLTSCHGDDAGFVISYQRPLSAEELGQKIHLPGQRLLPEAKLWQAPSWQAGARLTWRLQMA